MNLRFLIVAAVVFLSVLVIKAASDPQKISELIAENQPDTGANVIRISEALLGCPYDPSGPLGEGPAGKYDKDPLWRLECFDCTTFVETVTALALSKSAADFVGKLNSIRYRDGKVSYVTRNHFPSLEWIPQNCANGIYRDVTSKTAGNSSVKKAVAQIDRRQWYMMKKSDSIKIPGADFEQITSALASLKAEGRVFDPVTAELMYIPFDMITEKILDRIPVPAVVNFVRPGWDLRKICGTEMNVSHQGFLIRKDGVLYLRHASSAGKVMDQLFMEYVEKYRNSPTMKGFNLLVIEEKF